MSLPIRRLKFLGIFDINVLVKSILKWMKDNAYRSEEKTHKYKLGGGGAEYEIVLFGVRKIDTYFKYKVDVKIVAQNCREVEITKNNKVIKALHGRVRIWIESELITDWQKKFKGPFLEWIKKFYHSFIIKPKIGSLFDRLFYDIRNGLEKDIKEALQYETVTKRD